jgi:hypothetical protein
LLYGIYNINHYGKFSSPSFYAKLND